MRIDWSGPDVKATCPICGSDGTKSTVLTTDHFLPPHDPVTLVRCPRCAAVFVEELTTPDYGAEVPEMLDYYVEQGAGIDLIVAPLTRIPPDAVHRYLEIGCAFGYALDFSRFTFGWQVLGVDPSPLAEKGAVALDVPVRHAYFNAELDLGPDPFDLVFCSEVLEHVADPHSLLGAIRDRLSPDGLLVLSTPNADVIRPETAEGTLARALSAGLHLVLYTSSALRQLLTAEGFRHVVIEESPETLRATASRTPAIIERLLPPDPAAERRLLLAYLDDRAAHAPAGSVLASGFACRHLKECVNAGLYAEAVPSRARLNAIYRERYAIDLDAPASIESAPRLPFNIVGAFFFSGMLELNGHARPGRAADCFAAAIAAARKIRDTSFSFALYDGETEVLYHQSLKHLPMALAASDPARAVRELAGLAFDRGELSREMLDDTRAQTFVRLVNSGAYAEAEGIAPEIEAQLARRPPHDIPSLDPLYCLAMLALQRGRREAAAEQFGRVAEAAERFGASEETGILASARRHEELSRQQASPG